MFQGFSARVAAVRKRSLVATVYGHGMLDTPEEVQEGLLATMLQALPPGKSRDDVLMASHQDGLNISDGSVARERDRIVEAYKLRLSRQAEGKAKRQIEEAERRDFEAWKAKRA